jgi:hypothetical protein
VIPRPKSWRYEKVVSEHVFDKLRSIDCTFAEFGEVLELAEVIEETALAQLEVKEILLLVEWSRPLHLVVIVDDGREEERLLTVYEPDPERWADGYRRRR